MVPLVVLVKVYDEMVMVAMVTMMINLT